MLAVAPSIGCLPSSTAMAPAPDYRAALPLSEEPGTGDQEPRSREIHPVVHTQFNFDDPQRSLEAPPREWRYLVLHHTATERGDVATIDAEHRRQIDRDGKPWLGIGYHFVIGNGRPMPDGLVEPTFRWREQLHGAHAGDAEHNDLGIGICLVGNFEETAPTPLQVKACRQLVSVLAEEYEIAPENVVGHSQLKATACPGRLFPLEQMIVAARAPATARTNWSADEAVLLPTGAQDTHSARRARTVWPVAPNQPLLR
ncbi:MAG: N-acetylmuramoyl-L-alanine amidase [Pirellulales bacterium]|nr:N-acetylmuramoyl-L-alanine amidase [Pirellulales bacterium]